MPKSADSTRLCPLSPRARSGVDEVLMGWVESEEATVSGVGGDLRREDSRLSAVECV